MRRCSVQSNAFVNLYRSFDLSQVAGLARFHHREKGLRQGFRCNILGLTVLLDQRDEPEVGRSADGGQNPCVFRRRRARCSETDTDCGPESKCYKAKIVAKREHRKGDVCCHHVAASVLNTIAASGYHARWLATESAKVLTHLPADQITAMESVSIWS